MTVDFGPAAEDYVQYRTPFPPELFDRLARFSVGLPDQLILDVGAGTGTFADELAHRQCRVVASDVSLALLGRTGPYSLVAARTEALPFADASFDVVTAAQCWHWFDRDAAPPEVHRVLRRGGRLAVIYQMHLPLPGNVAEATEKLILTFNPRWRHANSAGISGQVLRDMQVNAFAGIESFSFDVQAEYTHEQWRGLIRTTGVVGASMPRARVEAFDREHARLLTGWPALLRIPHRVFAAVAVKDERL